MREVYQPLDGFAPDAEITTPGILLTCTNMVPSFNGFKNAVDLVKDNASAQVVVAGSVYGLASVRKIDDSVRVFLGTSTKLYEYNGATYTDVSRGGNYALGTESRWRFAQ